jgi:hypothetical protein
MIRVSFEMCFHSVGDDTMPPRLDRYQALDDDEPTNIRFAAPLGNTGITNYGAAPTASQQQQLYAAQPSMPQPYSQQTPQPYTPVSIDPNYYPSSPTTGLLYVPVAPKQFRNSCSRAILITASVLFALAGLGLIIAAVIQRNLDVLPICPRCSDLIKASIAVGAVMISLGALGLTTGFLRRPCLAYVYVGLAVLLSLGCVLIAIVATLLNERVESANLKAVWESTVNDDPGSVCQWQHRYSCSGFDAPCGRVETAAPSQCPVACASNGFAKTCADSVNDAFDTALLPIMILGYSLFALLALSAVAAVRTVRMSQ